jgi:hypothetical protein
MTSVAINYCAGSRNPQVLHDIGTRKKNQVQFFEVLYDLIGETTRGDYLTKNDLRLVIVQPKSLISSKTPKRRFFQNFPRNMLLNRTPKGFRLLLLLLLVLVLLQFMQFPYLVSTLNAQLKIHYLDAGIGKSKKTKFCEITLLSPGPALCRFAICWKVTPENHLSTKCERQNKVYTIAMLMPC